MKKVTPFMVRLEDYYSYKLGVERTWPPEDRGGGHYDEITVRNYAGEKWCSAKPCLPVVPYVHGSERERAWDRNALSPAHNLPVILGLDDCVLKVVKAVVDREVCHAARKQVRSRRVRDFMDSLGNEVVSFAPTAAHTQWLQTALRGAYLKARHLLLRCVAGRGRHGWILDTTTADIVASLMTAVQARMPEPGTMQCLVGPRSTRMLLLPDDVMSKLIAHLSLRRARQSIFMHEIERGLHKVFTGLRPEILEFMLDYIEGQLIHYHDPLLTMSDASLIGMTLPTQFWSGSVRAALRSRKAQQLFALAELHKKYPHMSRLVGDVVGNVRPNQHHINQKLLARAKKLQNWDPFKRCPHRRDALEYSYVWLQPLDKHFDLIMRCLQSHPVALDVPDERLSQSVRDKVWNEADRLQQYLGTEPLQYPSKTAAAPRVYPTDTVKCISIVLSSFWVPADFGRNATPWVSKTASGDFVLRPSPNTLRRRNCALREGIFDIFERGQRDLDFMTAFCAVAKYMEDTFADASQQHMLRKSSKGPHEEVVKARQRRTEARRSMKEAKRQRPPRFEHPVGHARGTKFLREWKSYSVYLYDQREMHWHRLGASQEAQYLDFLAEEMRMREGSEGLAEDKIEEQRMLDDWLGVAGIRRKRL